MKRQIALISIALIGLVAAACGPQTAEQKREKQAQNVYTLTDQELAIANSNGKAYFEKTLTVDGKNVKGQLLNCRPTDSNFNNLVSCNGYLPDPNTGSLFSATIYARYDGEGVSDQDTVQ
jgi:hypothetical protein